VKEIKRKVIAKLILLINFSITHCIFKPKTIFTGILINITFGVDHPNYQTQNERKNKTPGKVQTR
jgi:hypothetical protein